MKKSCVRSRWPKRWDPWKQSSGKAHQEKGGNLAKVHKNRVPWRKEKDEWTYDVPIGFEVRNSTWRVQGTLAREKYGKNKKEIEDFPNSSISKKNLYHFQEKAQREKVTIKAIKPLICPF